MYGAVDIGGTKTLVTVFTNSGKIIEQNKFPTPKDYQDFRGKLASIVANMTTQDFQRTVVAAPGMIDRKRGIGLRFGNLPWENVPIEEDVEKVFSCPVRVENDANLAALSEALSVKDRFTKVLYITVSTGIGGGIVINGRINPHFQDIEPGQMTLENQGRFEQWEDFASGSAIVKRFGKRASEITDPQTWYIIARNIAVGLNTLIATLDPQVIIIGGGVGSYFEKYSDRLEEQLKIYEHPMTPVPPIIKAKRPEEAVVYGCYELAKSLDKKRTHGKLATKS